MTKWMHALLGTAGLVVAVGLGYGLGLRVASHAPVSDATTPAAPAGERKILYYRNPMGLPDTSPTPKKDQMGMDYIPVYEGGDEDADPAAPGQIKISTQKVQKLGVRTETASFRVMGRFVRAAGRVEPDERKLYSISPKFEGFIERLHVNVTGQPVAKGQPLFEVYSPELVSVQREYAVAVQGVAAMKRAQSGAEAENSMAQLAESSLMRMKNWDISDAQVRTLVASGDTKRSLDFLSTVNGIVIEKRAVEGMRFMPGEMLYQIADLSSVWVLADVFEQDIGLVKTGAKAKVEINAYPGKAFEGRITYIYPTLKTDTRTVQVRVELPNPGLLLKPGMFAQVELSVGGEKPVLTVPGSAVIDSGTRRVVLVQVEEGRFEPRDVELGVRDENHVEVLRGVRDGESVVVAANFLIDAESNLQAALGGLSAPTEAKKPAVVGHQASGTVDGIDAQSGTISLNHAPVPSLNWPAMTMDFTLANASLLTPDIKPGVAVEFEFVERDLGEWVITRITVNAAAGSIRHAGH